MYTLEQKTQQIFILRAKQTLYFWRFGVNLLQNRMRCIYCIHLWGPEPHQGRISNFESEHLGIGNHLGAFSWAWQCSQMVSHNQKPEGWNQNYVSSMNRTKVTISLHEVQGLSFLFLTFRSWVLTPESYLRAVPSLLKRGGRTLIYWGQLTLRLLYIARAAEIFD